MVAEGNLFEVLTQKSALLKGAEILKSANIEQPAYEARLLFTHATGRDPRLHSGNSPLAQQQGALFFSYCEKRATHYPLQYILGKWPFMDLELFVGEGVLIPRADTEIVCITAAEKCAEIAAPKVLDLCAGSGAIGLAVKSLVPSACVTAVELYDDAFKYLQLNSKGNIQCVKYDIAMYHEILQPDEIDVLVSNPPYISETEMQTLEAELFYEPKTALTDNGNGLAFYKLIAKKYHNCIKMGGWLVFEIGYNQAQEVMQICKENGYFNISCKQDLGGNNRVVLAQKR